MSATDIRQEDRPADAGKDAPVLEVKNLRIRFTANRSLGEVLTGQGIRWLEAVQGVSLSVARGETVAVVGESGSGKTTLARTIIGLLPAAGGTVRFQGEDITNRGGRALKPVRRQMAMMFQDPVGSLSPRLTVRSLLAEPFRIHGVRGRDLRREVDRLLDMVNLPTSFGERFPHQLSGGQARRIGVARALALEPSLILADEPTAGLDVSVQGEILNLMNSLQDRLGLAILIITHNLNVVRHIADRVAIMYLGRFVEQGPTAEIFRQPCHPYTKVLLSANPEPDPDAEPDRLKAIGEVPSLRQRPEGCEFHTRCPFVRDRCREEAPPLRPTRTPGHIHTCHYPLG